MPDTFLEVTRQPKELRIEPGSSATITYIVTNRTGSDDDVRVKQPEPPAGSPLSLGNDHVVDLPSIVMRSTGRRACTLYTLPVRLWHS